MLKTKSRTVPIRLLCFMVTLLALALPARAWDSYYLVGEKPGWDSYTDEYKFTNVNGTWTLKLPKISGKWQIAGVYEEQKVKYGPSNNNDYALHDSWKTDSGTATASNPGTWKINDGNETEKVVITFTENGGVPSNISYDYYTDEGGSTTTPTWKYFGQTSSNNEYSEEAGSWSATDKTMTYTVNLNTGNKFLFKDGSNYVGAPSGTGTVVNGDGRTLTAENRNDLMWDGGDGEVTIVVTFDTNGNPTKVKVSGPEKGGTTPDPDPDPATPTWKYKGQTSTSNGGYTEIEGTWSATDKTMTYIVNLKNGNKFLFTDGSNYVAAPSGNGTVVNGDERALQKDNRNDLMWDGGDGDVTIVVTFDNSGNPVKVKVNGPEKATTSNWKVVVNGTEYSTVQVNTDGNTVTNYVSTSFSVNTNDKITITNGDKTYYRSSNDNDKWALTISNNKDNMYGQMKDSKINTDGENALLWNSDAATVKIYFTAYSDNTSIVDKVYVEEGEFEIATGYPRVYLLGDLLNDNVVTQQYEMVLNEATGKYELNNFALRNSNARHDDNKVFDNGFKVRYYYNADQYKEITYTDDAHCKLFDWMELNNANPGYPGWACNATFVPTLDSNKQLTNGSLDFAAANGESDIKKADVLPYLGILGANFVQENKYDTPLTHVEGKVGNTDLGWQEAYIVYSNGQPLVVNGKAQYNTIWPPRENILMQYKVEKDGNGNFTNNDALPVSTSTLTFRPTMDDSGNPVVKTASQWESDLKAEDSYAYSGLTFSGTGMMVSDQKYVRYVCPNMWMSGDFKVWTGWGGQPAGWGALWNNHFFISPTEDSSDNKNVVAGKTYKCHGNHDHSYNFNIAERGFYSSVEIFIPVNADGSITQDGQVDRTRMYVTNSLISAKIDASKNNTADKGYYKPSVTLPSGWSIDSYKVVRCDYRVNPESSDKANWQPVDANYNATDEKGATVAEGNGSDFTSKYASNDWTLDSKLNEGTYFYYLEVTCSNAGETKTVVVPSPYIDILATGYTTNVRLYQLVKDTKAGDDKYVTYSPTINKTYNVTVKNGEVSGIEERTEAFDYGSDDAQWTAMVACATSLPSKFIASTAAAKQVDKFEITYAGETVADLMALAKADVEASCFGNTYVGIKNFDTLSDFTSEWKAEFTAFVTDSQGASQSEVAEAEPAILALTMPVYNIEKVDFIVNDGISNGDKVTDAKVLDPKTGSTEVNNIATSLLNSLDVKVSLKRPNVVPELLSTLNAQFNDILAVGEKAYNVTYTDGEASSLTIVDEDPNNWLNEDWSSKTVMVSVFGANDNRFNNADLLEYIAEDNNYEAKLAATPLSLGDFKIPALRTKIKKEADKNELWERIYMTKTAMPLGSCTRSTLNDVTLNNNGSDESILLKVGDETALNNYVGIENELEVTTAENGEYYHHFSDLEDVANLVFLAESTTSSTWYSGIYNDFWISSKDLPTVTFGLANIFSGDTNVQGEGMIVAARANAPARVQANGATHYVLYPPLAMGNVQLDIQTAVDAIEADEAWIVAGAGYFDVKADGVSVYDVNGVKVADAQGRYDVNAGVYLASKAGKAVKIYVK